MGTYIYMHIIKTLQYSTSTCPQIHQVEKRTMRIPRYLSVKSGDGELTTAVEQSGIDVNRQRPSRGVLLM